MDREFSGSGGGGRNYRSHSNRNINANNQNSHNQHSNQQHFRNGTNRYDAPPRNERRYEDFSMSSNSADRIRGEDDDELRRARHDVNYGDNYFGARNYRAGNRYNNSNNRYDNAANRTYNNNTNNRHNGGIRNIDRNLEQRDLPPRLARLQNSSRNHQTNNSTKNNYDGEEVRTPSLPPPQPPPTSRIADSANSRDMDLSGSFENQLHVSPTRNHNSRRTYQSNGSHTGPASHHNHQGQPNWRNADQRFRDQHPNYSSSNRNAFSRHQKNANLFLQETENETTKGGNQREIMDELLRKAKYECIVCCDMVQLAQKTWNCKSCYNVFHLKCIQMWARSSNAAESGGDNSGSGATASGSNTGNQRSNGNRRQNRSADVDWRCPTCQAVQKQFPHVYYCFCGKTKEPELSNFHVPHSCGETCSRPLSLFNAKDDSDYFACAHKCTLMCHPGKCGACTAKIERTCACSKTKAIMNCVAKTSDFICGEPCNKLLNCGKHRCDKNCHYGDCGPCEMVNDVKCACGKETRVEQVCGSAETFACGQKCSKTLSCGFHVCAKQCGHDPISCGPCPFDPATVKYCPCGKTEIEKILGKQKRRLLCTDPIPECKEICKRPLRCGTTAEPHLCAAPCHSGACPPCELTSILRCECGANSQKFDCKDIVTERFKCKRKCNKKRSCGRHKCVNECCTDKEHVCQQICGRKLECGAHTCAEPCHPYCKACPNVIWTEVHCNCGTQVLYPPLPCSTKKPTCDRPCSKVHACNHPPTHTCNDDDECPPCTSFVSKICYGGHELCHTVPCYQSGVSCGRFCTKPQPCGHNCIKICHPGDCPACNQRCVRVRDVCQHPCGLPCHRNAASSTTPSSGDHCPESACKEIVKVYCKCKLKIEEMKCAEVNDPKKFQASVENMMTRYNFNASITLNEAQQMVRYNLLHQLECDERCAKEKRNRELATALGVDGHHVESVADRVKYSDFLRNEARANPQLVLNIHDKLLMLMNNYKKTNLKTMCYNFPPMNRLAREIIHNYAAHFGCKTESIDPEPNRSVIVTAVKTSTIPEVSLLEAVNVDVGQLRPKQSIVKAKSSSEENKDKKVIDYFNFSGQED